MTGPSSEVCPRCGTILGSANNPEAFLLPDGTPCARSVFSATLHHSRRFSGLLTLRQALDLLTDDDADGEVRS